MKNSNLNNELLNDEIDLRKIFITLRQIIRILSNSKKIVIVTTLVGLLIAFSYVHQRGPKYESQAALEIGAKIIQDYKLVNYLNIHLDFAKKLGNVEAVRTKDSFIKLSLKILEALISFSTKVTLFASLDKASIPKDPMPEYKSKILEFSTLTLIRFECFSILKILSLTESLNGRVSEFFKKLIDLPFKVPLIILIFIYYLPSNITSVKTIFPI